MQYRLRTLMLAVLVVCILASRFDRLQTWWWKQTRPGVTFAGSTFDDRDLALVGGVPQFAELTPQQSNEAVKEIVATYRQMGFLRARISTERRTTNRGWATCFVVDEGERYGADEVAKIVAGRITDGSCQRHGRYLCVPGDSHSPSTTPCRCPICDRTND